MRLRHLLELADSWAKVLACTEGLEATCVGIAIVREWLGVPDPVQLGAVVLQGEKDDDTDDGDGTAEGGRSDVVVPEQNQLLSLEKPHGFSLGPPREVAPLDENVEEKRDRHDGPNVVQPVRCPNQASRHDDGKVHALEEREPLSCVEKEDWQRGADEEAPDEAAVDRVHAEHASRTEGAPEYGGGEEGVDAWAREVIFLRRETNVLDPELEVHDADGDNCNPRQSSSTTAGESAHVDTSVATICAANVTLGAMCV